TQAAPDKSPCRCPTDLEARSSRTRAASEKLRRAPSVLISSSNIARLRRERDLSALCFLSARGLRQRESRFQRWVFWLNPGTLSQAEFHTAPLTLELQAGSL